MNINFTIESGDYMNDRDIVPFYREDFRNAILKTIEDVLDLAEDQLSNITPETHIKARDEALGDLYIPKACDRCCFTDFFVSTQAVVTDDGKHHVILILASHEPMINHALSFTPGYIYALANKPMINEIIADILSQICKEHGFLSIFLTDADYKVTVGNERA